MIVGVGDGSEMDFQMLKSYPDRVLSFISHFMPSHVTC